MPDRFLNTAGVRFVDRQEVIESLRDAVRQAREAHPEIHRVLLFGSLVRGDWTADSDADLIVVVARDFPDVLFSRSPYQIFCRAIPTDSLVYSQSEFERMADEAGGFIADALKHSIEL